MIVSIILFIIIFCVLVVSHELGHFLIAKKNGIHVVEFFIGMGPSLISFEKGGTKYSLKLLPIGGACVFEGEDGQNLKEEASGAAETDEDGQKSAGAESPEEDQKEEKDGSFQKASVGARFATVLAGPVANFVIAYLFALIIVWFCGVMMPTISSVTEGGAAKEAGLQEGDVITRINGEKIHMWEDIRLATLTGQGTSMTIEYERQGEKGEVILNPVYDENGDTWYIGIMGGTDLKICTVPETFQYGFYVLEYTVKATAKSLVMLVRGQLSADAVSGPVGMVQYVDQTYDAVKDYGLSNVIINMVNIAMMLSISLGVMNLLPLPALDGGRLVFLLIEMVRGKPVPPEKEGLVHLGGMIALMILMVFVLINDISKLI